MTTQPFPFRAATRWTALAAAAGVLLFTAPLAAAEYTSLAGVRAEGFQKWLEDAKAQGYVPRYISGFDANGHAEFSGVATKGDANVSKFEARYDMTLEEMPKINGQMYKKGFYPYFLSSYLDGKSPRFAAVWCDYKGFAATQKFRYALTTPEYEDATQAMQKDGLEPTIVTAYTDPGDKKIRISAKFSKRAGLDWSIHLDMTADQYHDMIDSWTSKGFRPRYVSVYDTPDGPRFLATAVHGTDPSSPSEYLFVERHGLSGKQYQTEFDKQAVDGFAPICICGYREGDETRFAVIWQKRK